MNEFVPGIRGLSWGGKAVGMFLVSIILFLMYLLVAIWQNRYPSLWKSTRMAVSIALILLIICACLLIVGMLYWSYHAPTDLSNPD